MLIKWWINYLFSFFSRGRVISVSVKTLGDLRGWTFANNSSRCLRALMNFYAACMLSAWTWWISVSALSIAFLNGIGVTLRTIISNLRVIWTVSVWLVPGYPSLGHRALREFSPTYGSHPFCRCMFLILRLASLGFLLTSTNLLRRSCTCGPNVGHPIEA